MTPFLFEPGEEMSIEDVIVENSRQKYGTPRSIVEEKIAGEWVKNNKIVEEKIQRRDEQSLGSVLTSQPAQTPVQKIEPLRTENQEALKPEAPKKERKQVDIGDLRKAIEESLKDIDKDTNNENH